VKLVKAKMKQIYIGELMSDIRFSTNWNQITLNLTSAISVSEIFLNKELQLVAQNLHSMHLKIKDPYPSSSSNIFVLEWTETAALHLSAATEESKIIYQLIIQCWQNSCCANFNNLLPLLPASNKNAYSFTEIPNLNTKLFNYQNETVYWLLSCENSEKRHEPFWIKICSVYFNICTKKVSQSVPIVTAKGGILADEVSEN
jgi:hypothetical protein